MLDNNGWEPFKKKVQKYLDELNSFSKEDFINRIAPLAQKAWQTDKILPSLTIAQAILESNWGRSELATQANALFGIKAHTDPTHKKTYTKTTWEYSNGKYIQIEADFKAYDSWEDSIRDRSKYLATRVIGGKKIYADVLGETDYKKACEKIYKAGYATDPNYPKKLIDIIEKYKLNKFDETEPTISGEITKDLTEFAVCYVNDGDLPNALSLLNILGDKAIMKKTSDATKLPAEKIIQVGGAEVKGADIVLAGDNRKLTQDEITKWVNSL